jgi:hypothetical protein
MYRFASDRIEACRVRTKDAPPIDVFFLPGDSMNPVLVHGRSKMTRTAASIDTDR